MEWGGVTSSGLKTSLVFGEYSVKVERHAYFILLMNKVFPWMKALTLNNGLTVQVDGVTAHTTKLDQAWCKGTFIAVWSK